MKLRKKKTIVTQPEVTKEIQELTINRIDDFPSKQFVRVIVNELPHELKLWEGEEYDSTCSWTLADVEVRIEELLADKKEKEKGGNPTRKKER